MELNSEQREAVNFETGAVNVQAAAGAGKTRVLVERYNRLVRSGVSPEDILCMTFTKSAAKEMAERAGVDKLRRGGFMTFHSFAFKTVIRNQNMLPFTLDKKVVASGSRISSILQEIVKSSRHVTIETLKAYVSRCQRAGWFPEKAEVEAQTSVDTLMAIMYREYQQKMRSEGFLDFEGLQLWAVHLLSKYPGLKARNQFAFVQADEAQDCEPLQWRMLQLVSERYGNAFVVGDVNQAMYEWRGAAPDNLLHFDEWFPGAKTLYLGTNYRSTVSIVDYSREIAPVRIGLLERLRSVAEQGERPTVLSHIDENREARAIVGSVTDPDNTAILARTNKQLRAFEDECLERGISYRLLGRSGFWQRNEIRQVLAFARAAVNPNDDEAIADAILTPFPCSKYLGKKFVERLLNSGRPLIECLSNPPAGCKRHEIDRGYTLYSVIRSIQRDAAKLGAADAIKYILNAAGVLEYHESDTEETDEPQPDNYALENVEELVKAARRFDSLASLVQHAARAKQDAEKKTGLTLSTVHQAKGKEWHTVFVAGVTEDVLPHKRGNEQEEARIYYVAVSRAAKRLFVSHFGRPSIFITGSSLNEQICAPATEVPATAPPVSMPTQQEFLLSGSAA